MNTWSAGLPPAAVERMERQRASSTAGSLLSAPAAAAIRAAGLAPAGEVFGCLVLSTGWSGGYCGIQSMYSAGAWGQTAGGAMFPTTPVVTSGDARGSRNGFGPYARAVEGAWQGALDRMLAEARALGADGVVGVRTQRTRMSGQMHEFTALGTAVRVIDPALRRAMAPSQTSDVWCADVSGPDCASAILSGLAPRGLAFGLSVSTKHEDWQMSQQRTSWSNQEVTGLTALVQAARDDARRRLATNALRLGGGDVVITSSELFTFDSACLSTSDAKDVHAEAYFSGTVLAPLNSSPSGARRTAGPGGLSITPVLPLSDRRPGAISRDPYHR